jgi:NADH-quinone oxidoreductase subunit G
VQIRRHFADVIRGRTNVINIEVNGQAMKVKEGETLLAALREQGVQIPALCHMDGFTPTGACRLCVVEIEGQRGLTPGCACVASEGMKVRTHSPRVLKARKTIVELLLAGHPDDCLYCVRNRRCELQKLAEELGVADRRFAGARLSTRALFPLLAPPDARPPRHLRSPGRHL